MPLSRLPSYVLLALLAAIATAQGLQPFATCENLAKYYKAEALKRVGPYGLGFRFFKRNPLVFAAAESAPDAQTAGVDFSETNVQVEGVDEPDLIKTDGRRVFTIIGDTFHVVNVLSDGSSLSLAARLRLPTAAFEMLFEGDNVLLIGRDFNRLVPQAKPDEELNFGASSLFFPLPFGQAITVIYRVSVAGPRPRLLSTLRLEGSYLNAREVDGVARIITTANPSAQIDFVYPAQAGGEKNATQQNRDIISATTSDNWISRYYLKDAAGRETRGFTAECSSVFRPSGPFTGFTLLTVTTVPLAGEITPRNSVSIASQGREIYSTASDLFVTTTLYRSDFFGRENQPVSGPLFQTQLHKFALSKTAAKYVASGKVVGSVLNQFAMHEYKGIFFVATTLGAPWWGSRDQSKSQVTSFRTDLAKRELVRVGQVGNLGVGERIFAVRYITSTAYVVTFRQVDPLYIIDLSNPAAMKVTGELKIPGFSSYLHPIKPGRILGVGREVTLEGRTTGAKVTLFDVSDVTNPTEKATWVLEGGFSNAEWDHRAFLFWAPESVAVLPIAVYGNGGFVGSVVLEISDNSVEERGRISQRKCCGSSFPPRIERNLVLGRTRLWSLSRTQLQINDIASLKVQNRLRLRPSKRKV